ncbi:hypothetical protein CHY08_27160 (plasmid) [Rhizobium leguminosarum bv. viciae]|uniref:hypothetical protein n=1 Tax=Rhizobium leguminosarum TaxID=384 RepID=UPI000B8CCB7A|nr:hypothetical protein [Rhizobium leguminosarum]ASR10762.1 hypothetical protein CHY08_27160 [Rhizobium leguminosarum bv. viciae]
MADKESGIISTIAQVVEKFVGDYSIWLWLMIFGACLIATDSYGTISIARLPSDGHSLAFASFLFAACMLCNAIRLQELLFRQGKALILDIRRRKDLRRAKDKELQDWLDVRAKARDHFANIMKVDCKERSWLVWFIFAYKKKAKDAYFIASLRWDTDHNELGFLMWQDPIMQRLVKAYNILKEYSDAQEAKLTTSDRLVSENIGLEDELKKLVAGNLSLKEDIRRERDAAVSASVDNEFKTYGDLLKYPEAIIRSPKPWFSETEARRKDVDTDVLA